VPQLSAQASIWNNVVYLNDLTANLNEQDFMGGSGVFSLDKPFHYSGKVYANVADLARLKPLLIVAGNNNEIAGSLLIDWQGSGEAAEFKNSGKLKLTLEKGRYANLQALQAKKLPLRFIVHAPQVGGTDSSGHARPLRMGRGELVKNILRKKADGSTHVQPEVITLVVDFAGNLH